MFIDMEKLRDELKSWYFANTAVIWREKQPMAELYLLLDEFDRGHPGLNALQLKTAQTEIIADWFTPVLFPHSPFPSEMGLKPAEDYGNGSAGRNWIFGRNQHLFADIDPEMWHQVKAARMGGLHECTSYPDLDHHVFPVRNVLQNGLVFYYEKAMRLALATADPEKKEFCECAARSLLAVKKILQRFAAAAGDMLAEAEDESAKACLALIAKSGDVPWRKPETFYEGLSSTWLLHEITASVEGLAMGTIGHPDYELIDLYRADIETGRITSDEAKELIAAFLCYIDCKQDYTKNLSALPIFGEQCGVLVLGGCDRNGEPVCNELTRLFLDVHRELKLVYPKLQVRFGKNSPQELYDLVNREFLCGRNTIGIVNDEAVIRAQLNEGKRLEDVREYVVGGCWEITAAGCEHSAGAMCYYNLPKSLELAICSDAKLEARTGEHFENACEAKNFEEFYRIVLDNTVRSVRKMCMAISKGGCVTDQVLPAPFFSSCMNDCLDNGKDYNAGGGRYNPHGLPLSGFATYLNSLLAVRHICFDTKQHTLAEFQEAMTGNWEGFDILRQKILHVPMYFGDDAPETLALAQQTLDILASCTSDIPNERGGKFQPALYNYNWSILGEYSKATGPTPDGRLDGGFISQGITPSHLRSSDAITTIFNICRRLDLSRFSAGSVLTLSISRNTLSPETLSALERTFLETGVEMLQLNCTSREELEDAILHPENHQDLIVRLYGYSARFTKLAPNQQREFIARHIY